MRSRSQFSEANLVSILAQLVRGLSYFMHLQILKFLDRVGNMYMERWTNIHQYINTCVFRAESDPYLSQDYALDLK